MFTMVYVFFEGACFVTLVMLRVVKHIEHEPGKTNQTITARPFPKFPLNGQLMWSATLGWTNLPDVAGSDSIINSQGIRADHDYTPEPPPCVTRIEAFGDSFTFGSELKKNSETWEEQLERLSPNTEVLNFGIRGYGLDQALLRYREDGIKFRPSVVLIGFITNDARRNLLDIHYDVWKPRFLLRNDSLQMAANILPAPDASHTTLVQAKGDYESGPLDFFPSVRLYKIVDHLLQTEGFTPEFPITVEIFDTFVQEVEANDSKPVIVLFPDALDIDQYKKTGTTSYDSYSADFAQKNYEVIDAMGAFKKFLPQYNRDQFFGNSHYTAHAAKIVGTYIHAELEKRGLLELQGCDKL